MKSTQRLQHWTAGRQELLHLTVIGNNGVKFGIVRNAFGEIEQEKRFVADLETDTRVHSVDLFEGKVNHKDFAWCTHLSEVESFLNKEGKLNEAKEEAEVLTGKEARRKKQN